MNFKLYPVLVLTYKSENTFISILEKLEKGKLKVCYTSPTIRKEYQQTKFLCFSNVIPFEAYPKFIKNKIYHKNIQTEINNFLVIGTMEDRIFLFDNDEYSSFVPLDLGIGAKVIAVFEKGSFRSKPDCPMQLKSPSGIAFFNDLYRILFLERK